MKKFLEIALRKYQPSKDDVETYVSPILALVATLMAVYTSAYPLLQKMMSDIKAFILCIIGGSITLLGISISGIAIVVALFTVQDIEYINKIKEGAFEELLWDFKFLAFHIAAGVIILSVVYFGEYIRLPNVLAHMVTYSMVFYIVYFLVFTVLYCASLVGNCIKLSSLKQILHKADIFGKSMYEQINEMVSERVVAVLARTYGFTIEEFYLDLVQTLQNSDLSNKDEIVSYLEQRYHLKHTS